MKYINSKKILLPFTITFLTLSITMCSGNSKTGNDNEPGNGSDSETGTTVIAVRDYYIFKDDGTLEAGGFWYDYPAFGPDGKNGIYRYGIEKTCAWTGVRNRPHEEDGKSCINIYATEAIYFDGTPIPWHRNGFMHIVPALNLETVTNLKFDIKVKPGFKGKFKILMENGVYNSSYFPGGYPIDPDKPIDGGGYEPIYPYWSDTVDASKYGFNKNNTNWQTITIPVKEAFATIDLAKVRSPFVIELTEVGDNVTLTNIYFENYTEYSNNVHNYKVENGTSQNVKNKYNIKGYNLVWNDEFNGDEINTDNWHVTKNGKVDEITGLPGYGNNEWQSYNEENVVIEDGLLKIISIFDTKRYYGPNYGIIPEEDIHEYGDRDSQFTSGRIFSKQKKEFKYGIIEASISLPFEAGAVDPGYWPAFWIIGSSIQEKAWPMSGEIDIMEKGGKNPDTLFATCHFGDSWEAWTYNKPDNYITSHSAGSFNDVWGDGFHTYTLEWTANSLKWYFDGELLLEFNNKIHESRGYSPKNPQYGADVTKNPMRFFQDDFYLILNAAVGVSNPDNDCATSADYRSYEQEKVMMVDWVRVYQK